MTYKVFSEEKLSQVVQKTKTKKHKTKTKQQSIGLNFLTQTHSMVWNMKKLLQ